MASGEHWSQLEVEATVANYMAMLMLELAGQSYNKSAHRRLLLARLNGRSDASIELKHANISAVLRDHGCQWIKGYKPRGNYQGLLADIVASWLDTHPEFDGIASAAANQPAVAPTLFDFDKFLVQSPIAAHGVSETPVAYQVKRNNLMHRDYLAQEARNASLGLAGERLILQYERHRLIQHGKSSLADRVEHISISRGDGAGFDILSFETTGQERFIEVKTTAFAKETPFFASRNEIEFARDSRDQFMLYRVFDFRKSPQFFKLGGAIETHCRLDPVSFLCHPA